jgi:hypothetical protein
MYFPPPAVFIIDGEILELGNRARSVRAIQNHSGEGKEISQFPNSKIYNKKFKSYAR